MLARPVLHQFKRSYGRITTNTTFTAPPLVFELSVSFQTFVIGKLIVAVFTKPVLDFDLDFML